MWWAWFELSVVICEWKEFPVAQQASFSTVTRLYSCMCGLIQKQRPVCIWNHGDCESSAKGPMEVLQLAGLVFWKQVYFCMYTIEAFLNFNRACTQRVIPSESNLNFCLQFKKKPCEFSWTNINVFSLRNRGIWPSGAFFVFWPLFIICPCFGGNQDSGHSGESRAWVCLLKYQITSTKELEITGKQAERIFPLGLL